MKNWRKPINDNGTEKILEVSSVFGTGNEQYHVYLANYFKGSIWKTENSGWRHNIQYPAITGKMIQRIIELIELGEIE